MEVDWKGMGRGNISQSVARSVNMPDLHKTEHIMCENYSDISLMNTAYKVFSVTLYFLRLQPIVEISTGNY